MAFSLEGFLERRAPPGAGTNLDSVFGDPGREGTLLEMPCNLPDAIIADIRQRLDGVDFSRYPIDEIAALRAQIVAWAGLPASHSVLFANGAFEIIDLVMQYMGAGATALTLDPDFFMYRLAARKYAVALETHPLAGDFAVDPVGLGRQVAAVRPDLVILSNPHNPTSAWFPPDIIEAVLREAPGLVLIDEVYGPFAPRPDACMALMDRYPNLMVLRSFSKMGAAAIRLGFLAGHAAVLERIGAWQTTFAVNSLSAMIAGSIVRHYGEIEKKVAGLNAARDAMRRQLGAFPGVRVYPSATNFIVVRLEGHDTRTIHRRLTAQGVPVLLYDGNPALKDCMRLSVDTPDKNNRTVEHFGAALSR